MTCQCVVYHRSLPPQSVILLRLQKMLRLVLAALALLALAQGNARIRRELFSLSFR